MTDANQPNPATPPAIPPVAPPAAPPAVQRTRGKFVVGLVLTILGGIWALVGLRNIAIAVAIIGDNPADAVGRVVGGLLIPIAMLIVGIILIRSSKVKA